MKSLGFKIFLIVAALINLLSCGNEIAGYNACNYSVSCALWVDPSFVRGRVEVAGTYQQLTDYSGFGNHLTAAGASQRPAVGLINGRSVMSFDGVDDYMVSPLNGLSQATIFIIFQHANTGEVALGVSNGAAARSYLTVAAGNLLAAGVGADTEATIVGGTAFSTAQAQLATLTYDGTDVNLYLNGVNEYTNTQNSTISTLAYFIGAENSNGTAANQWSGLIGEIIVYSGVLTGAEQAEVEEYLQQKWNTP